MATGDTRRWEIAAAVAIILVTVVGVVGGYAWWLHRVDNIAQGAQPVDVSAPRTVTPAPARLVMPKDPRVVFFGDSWTAGQSSSDPERRGYVAQVARMRPAWQVRAIPDGHYTGYLAEGPEKTGPYIKRLKALPVDKRANVLVMQGGLNDEAPYAEVSPLDYNGAVRQTLDVASKRFPNAQIVIVGPLSPVHAGGTPALYSINDRLKFEAIRAKLPMVSPYDQRWFPDEDSLEKYVAADSHPNDAGHAYFAKRLLASLETSSPTS